MLPPATGAAKHLDRLDDLSRRGLTRHVADLNGFRDDFLSLAAKEQSPEGKAQAHALALSAGGAATELQAVLDQARGPGLYLQVAFTGLEQAADLPAANDRERQKRFVRRLRDIPELLAHAPDNVETVTPAGRAAAQTMIRDCARYLTDLGNSELGRAGKAPRHLQDALMALKEFDRFVTSRPETTENRGPSFEERLTAVLGTDWSAEAILDVAREEFDRRLDSLLWLQGEIGNGRTWQQLYDGYAGPDTENAEPLDAVIREIHRLRKFVHEDALPGVFADTPLRIEPQPLHLASTLRPVHHDPALGAWDNEPSRCYISPQIFSGRGFRDDPVRLARVRREFPFVAAKQTYPGRHLLDSQRRSLGDSPMAQVTNPLFMEGWLAFAENLLEELGYLETPLARLVHHKRGLARAALAMVDAGLAVGSMDQEACLSALGTAGYSREEGLHHVRAILLAPSLRAVPVLGLHEITLLRERSRLPLPRFCTEFFRQGQIPLRLMGPGPIASDRDK